MPVRSRIASLAILAIISGIDQALWFAQ